MDAPEPHQAAGAAGYARISAAYFFYFVAFGIYVPYFPAYLRERGLDPSAVGWLIALAPLARMVIPPLAGLLADHHRGPRFWGAVFAWGAGASAMFWAGGTVGALTFLSALLLARVTRQYQGVPGRLSDDRP